MLIRFCVGNFLSYKEKTEFSMVRGKSRQHINHIINGGESRNSIDLLKGGLIYGANASGKSNLVKAIRFAQKFIVEGIKPMQSIPVHPFKLDSGSNLEASFFEFEIRVGGKDFKYGFELNRERVLSEWIYELKLTTETLLLSRKTTEEGKNIVDFGSTKFISKKEEEFHTFLVQGTRKNQLALNELIGRETDLFQPVISWFSNTLTIIFPETRVNFFKVKDEDFEKLSSYLERFDTGICKVELRPINFEDKFPMNLREEIQTVLATGNRKSGYVTLEGPQNERYFVEISNNGEISAKEITFRHRVPNCNSDVLFDIIEESDGSIRLLDLIPILYLDENADNVFVIDELDRSLHPELCYKILELFLTKRPQNSQIIATTHDSSLLTFDLLRRDEIWFADKNKNGESTIYSLEEFSPRYDTDIQKGYLLGRFGGKPIVGS